jgi:hypothetical protein
VWRCFSEAPSLRTIGERALRKRSERRYNVLGIRGIRVSDALPPTNVLTVNGVNS